MAYRGGIIEVAAAAGPTSGQRYTWSATFNAGDVQNMLRLRSDPMKDVVLYYQMTEDSFETATLTINQSANDVRLPLFVDVGPFGGGALRLGGSVDIGVAVDNALGATSTIMIWIDPGAQVSHLPPISRSIANLAQGVPTFVSPDVASTGWCPPRRPKLTFIATNTCDLEFIDAGGANLGRITYNPGTANREIEMIHPPKTRLRVNNTSGVNVGMTASWHRSA